MTPEYRNTFNTHPEFVGIAKFAEQIKSDRFTLEKALIKGDFQTARNTDFAITCFPNSTLGKYGYKYVVFDEKEELEGLCYDDLIAARKLLLAAYGFDMVSNRFSLNVPPIDVCAFDEELVQHVGTYSLLVSGFKSEIFIAGLIECGFSFNNQKQYWIDQRNQDDSYRILNIYARKEGNNVRLVSEVAFNDCIPYRGNCYSYELLTKENCKIKTLKDEEYEKDELVDDKYGRRWLYKYRENDHLYHIEESFKLVQDEKNIDPRDPYFIAITGQGIRHLMFSYIAEQDFINEDFIHDEKIKLKRLNGWIPQIIGMSKLYLNSKHHQFLI